ncbi:MAG: glycosyltransferase [Micromonosporaceae bacterium]|nr:glycosyltransferase [Micromonosporaceae bacterium]
MNTGPELSVVIPSYRDAGRLQLTLTALSRQSLPAQRYEVVAVLDGGGGPEYDFLEQWDEVLNLKVVRLPAWLGRSAARNAGIREAVAPLVLFLDADSFAVPELLRLHLEEHTRSARPRIVMGKRYEIGLEHMPYLLREQTMPAEILAGEAHADLRFTDELGDEVIQQYLRTPWLFAYTNNISVPHDLVAGVGGFDETFGVRWGWEDLELFYRVYLSLGRDSDAFVWNPRALCYHLPSYRDAGSWFRECVTNEAIVKRLHPHLDWEFSGPWPPTVTATRLSHYRAVIEACRRSGIGRIAPVWPRLRELLAGDGISRYLLIGTGASAVVAGTDCISFDFDAPPTPTNYHLLGTLLPAADGTLDAVVSVDFWRHLDWRDFCTFLKGAIRASGTVLLVSTTGCPEEEVEYMAHACGPGFTVVLEWMDPSCATIRVCARAEPALAEGKLRGAMVQAPA